MKEAVTEGLVYVEDDAGLVYKIAKVTYVEREDETYEYRFEPSYPTMELLGPQLFQGIPGLDLSLRKPVYVRENMTPVFIEERTPGPRREDLTELLDAVGMTYLNRLEWLIRTDLRYSGDHMLVRRWTDGDAKRAISWDELREPGMRPAEAVRRLVEAICLGHDVEGPGFRIDDANRAQMYGLLVALYQTDRAFRGEKQQSGIQRAKAERKYRGRKEIAVNPSQLDAVCRAHLAGTMTAQAAADELGMSKATFYRRLRKCYPRSSEGGCPTQDMAPA